MLYPPAYANPNPGPPVPPAFAEVVQALREATGTSQLVYMIAARQLCLTVCGAEEQASALRTAGHAYDARQLFARELDDQLTSYVLLRQLPEAAARACVQAAAAAAPAEGPARAGMAARLVAELRKATESDPEALARLQAGLAELPLYQLRAARPQVFTNLEQQFEHCSPYAASLMKTLKTSMGMLLAASFNAASMAPPPTVELPSQEAPPETA